MKKDIPRFGPIALISISALIFTFIALVWSLILLFGASPNSPVILLAMFVIWVSSPFVGFSLLVLLGRRWRPPVRIILYFAGIVSAAGALLIYNQIIQPPAGSRPAFIWLVTPAASWVFLIVAFLIAALISRRTGSAKTDD